MSGGNHYYSKGDFSLEKHVVVLHDLREEPSYSYDIFIEHDKNDDKNDDKSSIIHFQFRWKYGLDIWSLQFKNTLVTLDLSSNGFSSISDLSGLYKLKKLHLNENHIGNLSSIEGCTTLRHLYLGYNFIEDLSPLRNMKLKTLDLSNVGADVGIGDEGILSLQNMTTLTNLDVSNNNIRDISCLKDCRLIKSLNLSSNTNISDMSVCANMSELEYLNISHTHIRNMTVLEKCEYLKEVLMTHLPGIDYSPFLDLHYLAIFDCAFAIARRMEIIDGDVVVIEAGLTYSERCMLDRIERHAYMNKQHNIPKKRMSYHRLLLEKTI